METVWRNVPEFPHFRDLSLEDKPLFDALFNQIPPSISELTFTNLFIWRHSYQLKMSRLRNCLCLLADRKDHPFFFPPLGEGAVAECYQRLLHFLREKGVPAKIDRVPEPAFSEIDWKAEGMVAELNRDQCDYVYRVQDLIRLEGRKYHRKRNHIKQFKDRYAYQYTPIATEWVSECLRLQNEWCDLRHCEAIPGLANELVAIKEAFEHFETLKVKGGAILIDGKLEAFTLGEPLNADTVVIHIEKANPAHEGLYPMINQLFLEKEWPQVTYVNREQDLGEEGLRQAKESYFPHRLANKYTITLG